MLSLGVCILADATQRIAVEGHALVKAQIDAYGVAAEALTGLDLDEAEDTVANAQDGMERFQDVAAALSTPMYNGVEPLDDGDLMAELDALCSEDSYAFDMPSLEVPSGPIIVGPIAGRQTAASILVDAPPVPATFAAPAPAAAAGDQELADLMAFAE